jgi:M3 family oligoendopeptidase
MNFSKYQYTRPDIKELEANFNNLLVKFNKSESFEAQSLVMEEINTLRSEFDSMAQLAQIRHTIDTTDSFYEEEQNFFDETMPVYQGLSTEFYKALVNSKYKSQLKEKWGNQLFNIAELTQKTFSPEIIEDLQQENKLSSEYTKLLASAKIMFEGEERNLSQLSPFAQSTDRAMRIKANEAKYGFMKENEEKLDSIYDQLVKVRTTISKKLGFKNFVELAYARMLRSDYNADMVADNVLKAIKAIK